MLRVVHFQVDDVGVERPLAVHQLEVQNIRLGRAEHVGDRSERLPYPASALY